MKLSIIIPMYNAEKYIAACLDSILTSDLPKGEYEVLIVNDGSKDRGPKIAQGYCAKNAHFRYLTQENQGQSVARNYGIKEARGEYLWFVDADDKIDRTVLPVFQRVLSIPELDLLAFQLLIVSEDGHIEGRECIQPHVRHQQLMTGRNAILQGYDPSSVCALFIRRQMLTDYHLSFKEGITHQDVELSFRLFAVAKKVMFCDDAPYVYIQHAGSTRHAVTVEKQLKYLSDNIVVLQSFQTLSDSYLDTDKELAVAIRKRSQDMLFGLVWEMFLNRSEWKANGIARQLLHALKAQHLFPLAGPYKTFKKKLFCKLVNWGLIPIA